MISISNIIVKNNQYRSHMSKHNFKYYKYIYISIIIIDILQEADFEIHSLDYVLQI